MERIDTATSIMRYLFAFLLVLGAEGSRDADVCEQVEADFHDCHSK